MVLVGVSFVKKSASTNGNSRPTFVCKGGSILCSRFFYVFFVVSLFILFLGKDSIDLGFGTKKVLKQKWRLSGREKKKKMDSKNWILRALYIATNAAVFGVQK